MPMLAVVPLDFEQPAWLWLLLLIPVVVLVSLRVLVALEPVRRTLAIIMRSLLLLVLTLCLAGVVYVRTSDKLTVIFLMDRSDSVKELQRAQEEYLLEVARTRTNPEDRVGLIDFARNPHLQQLPITGGYVIQPGRLPDMDNRDRTDAAAALRLALATFPHDSAKRVVLMSDGNDNMGDVLAEASTAEAEGVVIDVLPLSYALDSEVYFDRLVAPTNVAEGDMVPLRMVLISRRDTRGRVDIYHNGRLVNLPAEFAQVKLKAGSNHLIVKVPAGGGGPQHWEARFIPEDPARDDTIEDNNYATAFSFVAGRLKVLLVSKDIESDRPLFDALQSEKIEVDLRDVSEAGLSLLDLMPYSTLILANIPADVFTEDQQKALTHYVSNLGGGLIMTGGDTAFGAGGWIGSPVAEILPVECEIKHKRVIPRGALVLIMHSCEIARGNFWGAEVAKKSVDTISSKDYIGVLAYTWSPGGVNWEVPLTLATNKAAIKRRIDKMEIGDMPDFDETMDMAVKTLEETDAAQKHVIIISDGDPQPPASSVLARMRDGKITCSTVGIGYGQHVMEESLRKIATETGGRFYPCRNPRGLPQIFVKESQVVRRPLIAEDPFTPQVDYAFSELLAGIGPGESPPVLGGLVMTSPRAEAQTALVRVDQDGTRDPLLAHWQAGLGKTVAFTSGLWPRWGAAWVSWPRYSKLWAQIVRWSMRQETPANFDVFTRVEGNKGRIIIDAVDRDAAALNLLDMPAAVIRPDQTVQPVILAQTGAGHYEAEFEIDQTGQYIANVAVRDQAGPQGSLQTGIAVPFSPEFRELNANLALLEQVRARTGGRTLKMDAPTDQVFSHDLPPHVSPEPAWDWTLAWLLLPLFLLDVAIRRLASWLAFSIFVEAAFLVFVLGGLGWIVRPWWSVLGVIVLAELVGWSIRFRSIGPLVDFLAHTATILSQAGRRSSTSLGQLRQVRERVREEDAQRRSETGPEGVGSGPGASGSGRGSYGSGTIDMDSGAGARGSGVDAGRRFSAEPDAGAAGDISAALGGARDAGTGPSPAPPAGAKDQPPEDTTGRLLRAKRRARRDPDPPEEKK